MRYILYILFTAGFIFGTSPLLAQTSNNQAMKYCLDMYGYTPEKFEDFNFAAAAGCYTEYAVAEEKAKKKALREFLDKKPWYKGKNWNWELTAEYTCTKLYDRNGIVVCHKPHYLN
jgi:hypothetical protein